MSQKRFLHNCGSRANLPVRHTTDKIVAYKAADIVISDSEAYFLPCTQQVTIYGPEATAICLNSGHKTPAPEVACYCGFYAWKQPYMVDVFDSAAKLQVELYGKVIAHEDGYRAEKQRVLKVDLSKQCMLCYRPAAGLYTGIRDHKVIPLCNKHNSARLYAPINPVDLANKLGTEVVWRPFITPWYFRPMPVRTLLLLFLIVNLILYILGLAPWWAYWVALVVYNVATQLSERAFRKRRKLWKNTSYEIT